VDYLTKPFDPWVLRAKVSVFVDLWLKNRQLEIYAEQARRYRSLLAAVDEVLPVLLGDDPDRATRAAEALERARSTP
jgi:hypothetical protein